MPVIPRLRDKKRPASDRKKYRQSMYQKSEYKNIRDWYMQTHPTCEICAANGLLTPATECHHKQSFCDTNISQAEAYRRLTDESNLIALCAECHRRQHHTTSVEEDRAYQDRVSKFGNKPQ